MVIKSSKDEPCKDIGSGDEIYIDVNNRRMNTTGSLFTEHEYCQPIDQVNIKSDIFSLQSSSSAGFCIESISINGEQILGSNSSQYNCGDAGLTTSKITIQNGEITVGCEGLNCHD